MVHTGICASCGKSFTYSGFTCHGRRGSNLACRDAYQSAILDQLVSDLEESDDSDVPVDDIPYVCTGRCLSYRLKPDQPVSLKPFFEPDAGNISEPDNDDLSPPNTDYSLGDESDSEDSDLGDEVDNLSDVEFLPLDIAVGSRMLPDDHGDAPNHIDDDGYETDQADNPAHVHVPIGADQADHNNQHDGIFIQRFTKGHPGAAVGLNGLSAQHDYQDKLKPNASGNVYAPFASRIDWEFAKWAKSCGVSSRAVTNLLAIEGVCSASYLEYINDAIALSRYGKP